MSQPFINQLFPCFEIQANLLRGDKIEAVLMPLLFATIISKKRLNVNLFSHFLQ